MTTGVYKHKSHKCRTCHCQVLGAIRPECLRGVIGYRDGDRWRFDPLPCAFNAVTVLDAPPRHHNGGPKDPARYRLGKRCANCGDPICNSARRHCRPCSSKLNGAKRKGGPPNEAWRTSMTSTRAAHHNPPRRIKG